jgi:hypothetical protein
VTAIGDVGGTETLPVFQALRNAGKQRIRLWKSIPLANLDDAIACGLQSGIGDEWIKIGAVKIFTDGALGSRSAWLLKPYTSDRKSTGVCRMPRPEFDAAVKKAARSGLSVCVHAIGDAAVRMVIDVLIKYNNRFPPQQPPRIEHLQLIAPDDLPRLRGTNIIASMQPSHLLTDRDYADRHWGRRSRLAFAFRSLWDLGVPLAFGSDVPIEPIAPITGIGAAVHRAKPGDTRGPWYRKQRLSVWEAVWGFTVGAAIASGEQARRGMIRPGFLADLTVLDHNIFTIPPKSIFNTQVSMTFVGGRRVYEAES